MRFLLFLSYLKYAIVPTLFIILLSVVYPLGIALSPGLSKILFDKIFVTLDHHLMIKYVGISSYIIICSIVFILLYAIYETLLNVKILCNAYNLLRYIFQLLLHVVICIFKTLIKNAAANSISTILTYYSYTKSLSPV